MEDSNAVLAKQEKERHETSLRKKETELLRKNSVGYTHRKTDEDLLSNPSYSFLERNAELKFSDDFVTDSKGNEWVNLQPVEKITVKTNIEQNAKELDKTQKELAEKERTLKAAEKAAYIQRAKSEDHSVMDLTHEDELLKSKLALIKTQKTMDLKRAQNELERQTVELRAIEAEVSAREEFLHMIPLDHPLRRKAVKKKEKATDERRWAKWKLKILTLNGKQLKHEKKQLSHKKLEAMAQSFKSKHDDNCQEDAILKVTIGGEHLTLINMGKAYMGGSKISYIFQDPETRKRYLYKKAENCVGFANPKGAVMTKLGADFQKWLDPTHTIPATAVKNESGKYVGSIQEIVDLKKQPTVDFEKWQQTKEENRDPSVFTEPIKEQFLRFHLIDWLLCNFDTKGENLLQREDGQFVSIDKEGALTHIRDEGAQRMSVTYSPHTDEPIYNIFFRMFRDGKIDDLPLEKLSELIDEVENKSDEEYMEMFKPYFGTLKKHRKSKRALILKRKKRLRASYITFLNELRPQEKPGNRLKKQ